MDFGHFWPNYQVLLVRFACYCKMAVFLYFLEKGSNDSGQNAPECRTNQYRTARENRMSRFCSVLEIFIHKVSILAENGQSGV